MKLSFYYRIFIFVITMLVWYLIYLAKISDYSINYEYEFKALGLSLTFSIVLTLINQSTNSWSEVGSLGRSDNSAGYFSAGSIALSGTLTAIRITTVGSADTFDAGSINILYE